MPRIRRAMNLARQAGEKEVTVPVEDLERLLAKNKDMDERLAKYVVYLPKEVLKEITGEDNETPSL